MKGSHESLLITVKSLSQRRPEIGNLLCYRVPMRSAAVVQRAEHTHTFKLIKASNGGSDTARCPPSHITAVGAESDTGSKKHFSQKNQEVMLQVTAGVCRSHTPTHTHSYLLIITFSTLTREAGRAHYISQHAPAASQLSLLIPLLWLP